MGEQIHWGSCLPSSATRTRVGTVPEGRRTENARHAHVCLLILVHGTVSKETRVLGCPGNTVPQKIRFGRSGVRVSVDVSICGDASDNGPTANSLQAIGSPGVPATLRLRLHSSMRARAGGSQENNKARLQRAFPGPQWQQKVCAAVRAVLQITFSVTGSCRACSCGVSLAATASVETPSRESSCVGTPSRESS